MIPDKIYLIKDGANPEDIFDTVASKKPMFQDDVCYIRKDALLEWLDGKMTIEGATEGFVGGYDSALKDVIEYIKRK